MLLSRRIAQLFLAGLVTAASPVFAQTRAAADVNLATPTRHEVSISLGSYNYVEPGDLSISIHSPKFGVGYLGTLSLGKRRLSFAKADVRGSFGDVTYDGFCSPFLITPNSSSPNGFALGFGDASPCSESGDNDWYFEGRALVGRDFIRRGWGLAPETGLGVRHLSNGTTGAAGYRTDDYLYLPVGITARTSAASGVGLGLNLEYDQLLHGWQTTRQSALGGGIVSATATAPAFTIDGFSDVSFAQKGGWALRASAKLQLTTHWSVEPSYVHWRVSASSVSFETATFTVHGVTAHEQLGFLEPLNTTNELALKLGFHF